MSSSLRKLFPGYTLCWIYLKTWWRSGWSKQVAEEGRFESTTKPLPQLAQPSWAGRSARAAALRRPLLTPQKCQSETWPSNPQAMKGQRPESTVAFFLPHVLCWKMEYFKNTSPRIFCSRQSNTQNKCKIKTSVFVFFSMVPAGFSPLIWWATLNKKQTDHGLYLSSQLPLWIIA